MQSQNPAQAAQAQNQVVTTAQFNAKFRSKPEVFRFLAFDVGAYLPPYATITVWHLRDLAGGKRKFVKAAEVKTIQVPHFDGLTFDSMMYHAKKFPGFQNYLPADDREVEKLPRAYIANLIYTIVGQKFKDWVQQKIQERTKKIMEEQDLAIEMDPEVYMAFQASNK